MTRLRLLYTAVFLMQYATAVGITGMPLVAQFHFDCSFWTLTLIGMAGPLTYTVSCLLLTRTVGRVKPFKMMFAGAFFFACAYVLAAFASSARHLILISVAQAAASSLFWPMMEMVLAEGAAGPGLGRRMGRFNICWSLADAFGAATAAALYKLWPFAPFVAVPPMVVAAFAVTLLASRRAVDVASAKNGRSAPDEHAPARITESYRKAAWVANFFAFGVTGVVRSVFAAAAQKVFYMSGPLYGLVVAVFSALRTLTFVVLGHWHAWHYRKRHFFALNSLLVLGMLFALLAAFMPSYVAIPLVFVSFAACGVGVGMTYTASIFYSLSALRIEDTKAHLHEAVLGGGAGLFTIVSGVAIALAKPSLGEFANVSPLPVCALAVLLGMALSAKYLAPCAAEPPKNLEHPPRGGYPE